MIRDSFEIVSGAATLLPRLRLLGLLLLMLGASLSEGLGILLLIPLLADRGSASSVLPGVPAFFNTIMPTELDMRLALFVVLIALRAALVYSLALARGQLQLEFVDRLRMDCNQAVILAEWRWLANKRVADRNATLLTNCAAAGVGLDQAISLLAAGINILVLLSVSIMLSWRATLAAMVCGAALLLIMRRFRSAAYRDGRAISTAQRDLYRQFEHSLAALRDMKMHADQSRLLAQFEHAMRTLRSAKLNNQRRSATSTALVQVLGAAGLAAITYASLQFSHVTLPLLIPQLVLIARVFPAVERVQQGWSQVLNALPALEEIIGLQQEAKQHCEPVPRTATIAPLRKEIALAHITVYLPARERPALNDVSITFPAGSTTALVGPSGAGKSTLADIVAGLIMPDSGSFTIDGKPLAPGSRAAWRQSVAYVEQAPLFSHASIRENLVRGRNSWSDTELLEALNSASAQFVTALPLGLDTIIGDSGLRLSGGERQRLALARALLQQPQVLILDEATSALDEINEQAVVQAVQTLQGTLTIITISHRQAMLEICDQIIQLQAGCLIRSGAC